MREAPARYAYRWRVVDENGRVQFNALQHSRPNGQVQFYAFDIFVHKGRKPIEQHRELLEDALRKVQYPVLRSISFDAKPADLIRAARELELEGVIAKRNAPSTDSWNGMKERFAP